MKRILLISFLIALTFQAASAQNSAFTYQGKLTDNGNPASGTYDLTFRLFDTQSGGAQIGTDQLKDDVQVTIGIFTVNLDFGSSPFTSTSANYLEISVRPGVSTGAFTTLTPRQPITSSPYAIQTLRADSAAVADNATNLGGLPASQFTQNNDLRLSDARPPTAGSPNYIQNGTSQQTGNFNIAGNGTVAGQLSASVIRTETQFNIGVDRILKTGASGDTFLGLRAGNADPQGQNTFLGYETGKLTTTGGGNTFVGAATGTANITGGANTFVGQNTGISNTDGSFNTFIGGQTGQSTASGYGNTFIGSGTGYVVGVFNGVTNNWNTALGVSSHFGLNNLKWATAIGANSQVNSDDTVVIGKAAGTYGIFPGESRPADRVVIPGSMLLGAGVPNFRLHLKVDGQDGIKLQHTGVGLYPQVRWTDANDVFKASIGYGSGNAEGMRFFLNGADRLIIQNDGVIKSTNSVFITNPNTLIITSANGACWGITVNNSGVLGTFSTTCP